MKSFFLDPPSVKVLGNTKVKGFFTQEFVVYERDFFYWTPHSKKKRTKLAGSAKLVFDLSVNMQLKICLLQNFSLLPSGNFDPQ